MTQGASFNDIEFPIFKRWMELKGTPGLDYLYSWFNTGLCSQARLAVRREVHRGRVGILKKSHAVYLTYEGLYSQGKVIQIISSTGESRIIDIDYSSPEPVLSSIVSNRPRKVFLDLDGVVVDYDKAFTMSGLASPRAFHSQRGAYLSMEIMPGAYGAIVDLIGKGFDVYLASKPPSDLSLPYSEKAEWVQTNLPSELANKLILTNNKGILGDHMDFLVDDNPGRAGCQDFRGTLIEFVSWPLTLQIILAEEVYVSKDFHN